MSFCSLYLYDIFSTVEDKFLLDLIEKAKNKDQKSQTKLVNKFWVSVFSFVMKKVKNETEADEITVNVFSKVLSKIDLYDPNFQFKTWVLTIAQNTVIDYWRKKNRDSETSIEYMEEFRNTLVKSPEELLISEEEDKEIIKVIESLEANYQEIINLIFFEEKSIKEISDILNISVSNAKVRIMRAKKVLKELLKNNINGK